MTEPGKYREGDRVRLVATTDPYTNLKPGATGTVAYVDDARTVHVDWDNGSTLGMLPGLDRIIRVHVADKKQKNSKNSGPT